MLDFSYNTQTIKLVTQTIKFPIKFTMVTMVEIQIAYVVKHLENPKQWHSKA